MLRVFIVDEMPLMFLNNGSSKCSLPLMSHFLWTEEQRRVEPAVFRNWQDIVYLSLNTLMKNRSVAGFQSSSSHFKFLYEQNIDCFGMRSVVKWQEDYKSRLGIHTNIVGSGKDAKETWVRNLWLMKWRNPRIHLRPPGVRWSSDYEIRDPTRRSVTFTH